MRVEERGKDLVSSSRGEFWRLLTPGLNVFFRLKKGFFSTNWNFFLPNQFHPLKMETKTCFSCIENHVLTAGEYTIWAFTEGRSSVKVQIEVKEGEPGPRIDLHLVSSALRHSHL